MSVEELAEDYRLDIDEALELIEKGEEIHISS